MWKLVDVEPDKWKSFKKYCANKEITMKAELDRFLNKFVKGAK